MTKEEKIKEAYGEFWENFHPAAKKCALNKNGWITSIMEHAPQGLDLEFDGIMTFRPKSLQGLEENNEWIKILSEEDLPKHTIEYHVVRYKRLEKALYRGSNRWLITGNDYPKTTEFHAITHYQEIKVPNQPIY
jgi:hypothetical protein